MSQSDHVQENVKATITIFPILAFLILVTVAVHQMHLPYKIQLIIEIIKAVIAVGYFIHLIANRKDVNMTWMLTIIFVAALLFLPIANGLNHIYGTQDVSKALQMENLNKEVEPAGGEHDVH